MNTIDKNFIKELKSAILKSRYQAARVVNKELINLYFNIGKKISINTKKMAWGSKVLEQISNELQNELPGLKGFSGTNLKRMASFFDFWNQANQISPTLSDQLANPNSEISPTVSDQFTKAFYSVSFSHHYLIASKSKSIDEAQFYIYKTANEFWPYRNLQLYFKNNLFQQLGSLPNNFEQVLPSPESNKAIQVFKDEYLLDFVNIEDPDEADERLIENEIVRHIKKFIQALGPDFAFIGNQFRLIIEEQESFIDLLFFNRKLQALVAFDLKKGKFKPEYLGKMNFYLSALDDLIKQPHENASIGIILCREKNNKIVEYSFRDFIKPWVLQLTRPATKSPSNLKMPYPMLKR